MGNVRRRDDNSRGKVQNVRGDSSVLCRAVALRTPTSSGVPAGGPGHWLGRQGDTTDHLVALEEVVIASMSGSRPHVASAFDERDVILAHAYACCRANGGAPGVDGETFANIEEYGVERWLTCAWEEVRTERYTPQPVKRVMIPKPGGPGKRLVRDVGLGRRPSVWHAAT